jgi:GT2 family glycosyltransferase
MDEQRFYDGILFVIVVYEKQLENISSIKTIADFYEMRNLTPSIFIYDNSKLAQSHGGLIHYLHDTTNSGVSRAYNLAANFAATLHKNRMCLLDQDTSINEQTLDAYFHSYCQFPDEHVFVPKIVSEGKFLSPYKTVLGKGYSPSVVMSGRQATKNYQVINSGLVIDINKFNEAGGYDELYPLDLSDNVFWKRLSKVAPTFVITEASCKHDHSASVDQPEHAISRFKIFLKANRQFRHDTHSRLTFIPVISRGIKLTWRFKNFLFVRLAFKSFTS